MASGRTTSSRDRPRVPVAPENLVIPPGLALSTFSAMGTTVSLLLPTAHTGTGLAIAREVFAEWEQTLSRFLPTSELSQLNQQAGQPVIVSQLLFTVLRTALAAAQETDGLYDPTLLPQLLAAGYDRSFSELPEQRPARQTRSQPGGDWRKIQLEPALRGFTLPPGCGLDFGGIANGMAVDAVLARLQETGIEPALVNAGGDLAVLGLPPGYSAWPIAVQGKDDTWMIPLHHGALATSSVARRRWRQGTQTSHHLLDPRTGESIQSQLWSVTVAAGRCMQAEVATKAVFLLGLLQGKTFLVEHALAGLLVQDDNSWIAAGNWPVDFMQPLKDTDNHE